MTITMNVKQREFGDWIAIVFDGENLLFACDDITPHGAVEKAYRRLGLDSAGAAEALLREVVRDVARVTHVSDSVDMKDYR